MNYSVDHNEHANRHVEYRLALTKHENQSGEGLRLDYDNQPKANGQFYQQRFTFLFSTIDNSANLCM